MLLDFFLDNLPVFAIIYLLPQTVGAEFRLNKANALPDAGINLY